LQGVTLWGVYVAWSGLPELRKQAKAAKDAAVLAKDAIELSRGTAKQQLRAYITVRDARAVVSSDGAVEASLSLHNCGQTPAYALQGASRCSFSHYPVPDFGVPGHDIRKSVSVVGADRAFHILCNPQKLEGLTFDQTVAFLRSPNRVFFVIGYFTYKDVFKDEHFIRFQTILGGPSGALRWDTDDKGREFVALCNDSVGNDAD
jgi:hypothetical protein